MLNLSLLLIFLIIYQFLIMIIRKRKNIITAFIGRQVTTGFQERIVGCLLFVVYLCQYISHYPLTIISFHAIPNGYSAACWYITGSMFISVSLVLNSFIDNTHSAHARNYNSNNDSIFNRTLSSIVWMVYLFLYEILLREIFLNELLIFFSIPVVIGINTIVYCLLHIQNGYKETLASIPFGIFLCLTRIDTGSILIPILLHYQLAAFSTIPNIYNPKTIFKIIHPHENISNRR
jgi:membrane protease YdiL (CAAX protease family)